MKEAAIGIIFKDAREKDEVLLVQRKDVPVWVLPGGGIDEGEQPAEAALREVLEETGLEVKVIRKTAEYYPVNGLSAKTFTFECKIISGELRTSDETEKVQFFPVNALPKKLFPLHQEWIEDAFHTQDTPIYKPISLITYGFIVRQFIKHPWLCLRFFWTKLRHNT